MRRICMSALLAVPLGVIGCASNAPPPAPPVTEEQLMALQSTYHRANPDARVGEITAVLGSDNLALVGRIPIKGINVGDIITITDSNGQVLTMGHVEAVNRVSGTLSVRFDEPTNGMRRPTVGDVAMRLIE